MVLKSILTTRKTLKSFLGTRPYIHKFFILMLFFPGCSLNCGFTRNTSSALFDARRADREVVAAIEVNLSCFSFILRKIIISTFQSQFSGYRGSLSLFNSRINRSIEPGSGIHSYLPQDGFSLLSIGKSTCVLQKLESISNYYF